MDDQKETSTQPPKPRTSKLAIIASVMVLVCIIAWIFWPTQALLITIYTIALLAIGSFFSMIRRKGIVSPPPVLGFLIPIIAILSLATLMPVINKVRMVAQKDFCITHLKGLGVAIMVYANDHNDLIPPADHWCDLLITEEDVAPKSLLCPYSDAIEGESSYAVNINATGKDTGMLPKDMVLLFETETGIDPNGRTETIQDRAFFQFFQKQGDNWLNSIKNNKVYPNRWNQSGGPEILSMLYHKGEGCNVLFADGHSEYVPSNEIPHLRWTADANSMN